MLQFLIGCALGAVAAACITVPLFAPWPIRVRYLVTTSMTDPWSGFGSMSRLEMREVRLSAIESDQGDVEVAADDGATRITLTRSACMPSALARLDGWMALGTPLLVIVDHGHADVFGPDGAVTNFSLAAEKVR